MRAVLILAVLMAWVWCIVGAVGLTGFLVVTALGARRAERTPSTPPPLLQAALAAYALIMAACGAGLTAVVLHGDAGGSVGRALRWAALPWWAAAAAVATLVVLRRRVSGGGAGGGLDPAR